MRYMIENILHYMVDGIKFLLFEPFLLIKTYLAPDGCMFIAYDYKIKYENVNGEKVALFAEDMFPHLFRHGDEAILPVKSQIEEEGFPFVYTKYTDKNFFVDVKNNILYIKTVDLAFGNVFESYAFINKFIHKKRRDNYAADALAYFDKRQNMLE